MGIVHELAVDDGWRPAFLAALLHSFAHMPEQCPSTGAEITPDTVLMGCFSTLPAPIFLALLLIDCFNLKQPTLSIYFPFIYSLKRLLSVVGRSYNSNFQSRSPPKMQNAFNNGLSLYQPHSFLPQHSNFGPCSQSVFVFFKAGRWV